MSTRSHIGVRNADDTISFIYCHFDGYPSGVGNVLKKYYQDGLKIQALLNLGDISILAERVSPEEKLFPDDKIDKNQKHTFDNPIPGVTVAYHRDRGEDNTTARVTREKLMTSFLDQEYAYLYENNTWKCFHCGELLGS